MQIVRTIIWVLILFAMLTFSFFNWDTVEVNLWENLVLETKIPVLVIVAFLLGLVPTWLYHRSVKWSLGRRIRSLEASIKSTALAHRHEPPSDSLPEQPEPLAATGGTAATASVEGPVEKPVDEPAELPGAPTAPINAPTGTDDNADPARPHPGDKPA